VLDRTLVGEVVHFATPDRQAVGILLSLTRRSAWLVVDDEDVVVPYEQLTTLARCTT